METGTRPKGRVETSLLLVPTLMGQCNARSFSLCPRPAPAELHFSQVALARRGLWAC
jgi:hypothetical protein